MKTNAAEALQAPAPASRVTPLADPSAISFMGPGQVLQVEGDRIAVRRSDGQEVDVTMALAVPYRPVQDDTLLLVGGPEGHFAIGVLHGAGQSSLALPGDVEIHAVGGELSLRGDAGIAIDGPSVAIRSQRFKVVADAAVQKLSTWAVSVRDLWSMKTKKAHILAEDDIHQRSRSATMLTEEAVVINGKTIHVG